MKKLLLILAICLSLIGCSKDAEEKPVVEEKEKVTYNYVQTIEVEGVCNENHATINDEYKGSIDIYQRPSTEELVSNGYVKIKDIENTLTFANSSEESFSKRMYSYRVPYRIDFFAWNEINQNVLALSEIEFEGISNFFPMSEDDIEKPYLSTCQLTIIERKIDNPHQESE